MSKLIENISRNASFGLLIVLSLPFTILIIPFILLFAPIGYIANLILDLFHKK